MFLTSSARAGTTVEIKVIRVRQAADSFIVMAPSLAWRKLIGAGSARKLAELTAIGAWREAGQPAKCRRERARLAESHGDPDLGHRHCRFCKQHLAAFYSPLDVIAMRWDAERLLEGAGEVIGAQPRQARQGRQRNVLIEVFLDMGRDHALLPAGKPAAHRRTARLVAATEAPKLVHQNAAKSLEVGLILG